MTGGRRFGAEGIRRGLRCGISGSAAAEDAVTLDDIYARHAWAWWLDGAHGVDVLGQTWTERVSGEAFTASAPSTIAATTVAGVAAVDVVKFISATGEAPAFALNTHRMFIALAAAPRAGGNIIYISGNGSEVLIEVDTTFQEQSYVGDGVNYSTREGTSVDDNAPHVMRAECNGTHASNLLRVDGATYATEGWGTADPTLDLATVGVLIGDTNAAVSTKIVAIFACAYATINDTQAAQVETDLLTIMGL